ncbi:hypothetical protein HKX17_17775 [Sulfitobacter sp. KE34]|uniref:hypothetical protein n=1 Tax=unclassified Sulfitobacter TaxID=196795 RepID=UPI0023E1C1DB|nr:MULTISPECIES: hypothetical protein [unclassified Sulfitobacter]MDF3351950.1 hypothetical protein [Sulfitobacter sp. KE12]MDF3355618.1 hypothetical protein [Sulfitobacter sp. KE27]MDF3359305.1 hypothetical protein [Sulfitobacter sp. KE33]MDF3366748.1 hypothetical protein [Sulfitobacter sp. Ks34]MDF3370305.1 hypothetical protein [Sulfitobacter sp. Ks43]
MKIGGGGAIPDPEPFEAEDTPEDDLWFLPGPDPEEDLPPGTAPEPRRASTPLFDPAPWAAAQAGLAMELAEVALLYGALDQRLRLAPAGWRCARFPTSAGGPAIGSGPSGSRSGSPCAPVRPAIPNGRWPAPVGRCGG